MAKWARRIGWTLGFLLAILGAAFLILRTPDTDRNAMVAKYGGATSQFVTLADGTRVHVRDTGGTLPPMVLLHGSNSSLHTWEPLVRELSGEYRIIRLDLPGHGLTGANAARSYRVEDMMAAVDGTVTAIGVDSFILGGNSMGGGISWRYALEHPAKVRAILLLNAGGMPPRGQDAAPKSNIGFRIARSPLGRWIGGEVTPRPLIRRSLEQSVADPALVDEAMVDRYWELLLFPGNRDATIARFGSSHTDPAIAERAREIRVPTLILFGKEDRIINPSAAQSFAERISGSETILFDNIGHLPMEEAPAQTAAAIRDFLSRRLDAPTGSAAL
ncbi:MAG: alpha/beta hydrolase [Sphingopyxis sp.]|nr:alpha/beta hydrolase [Sphingopyxis sp.]